MKTIKEILHLIYGFLQFSATERNSEKSHQAFVKLFVPFTAGVLVYDYWEE